MDKVLLSSLAAFNQGTSINTSIERIRQTTIWQSTFSSICTQINISHHICLMLDATNINRVNGMSSQPHVSNSTQFQRLTLAVTVSPTTSTATTLQARHHQLFTEDTSGRISQNVQTTRSRATHSTCTQDQEQLDQHGQRHQHKTSRDSSEQPFLRLHQSSSNENSINNTSPHRRPKPGHRFNSTNLCEDSVRQRSSLNILNWHCFMHLSFAGYSLVGEYCRIAHPS